jgi:hypothetical protein
MARSKTRRAKANVFRSHHEDFQQEASNGVLGEGVASLWTSCYGEMLRGHD